MEDEGGQRQSDLRVDAAGKSPFLRRIPSRDVLEKQVRDMDMRVADFQRQVAGWVRQCFGEEIAVDRRIRALRFLEEALELVQASDLSADDVLKVLEYVYARPVGELHQEVGGVAVTLSALCSANDISMTKASQVELARCILRTEEIRQKQVQKSDAGLK